MYLTRIMSLTPVTSFSCQEITKGLSNSPSAIIYKLFNGIFYIEIEYEGIK